MPDHDSPRTIFCYQTSRAGRRYVVPSTFSYLSIGKLGYEHQSSSGYRTPRMHLAIHPARSGVPAHSKALLNYLDRVVHRPPRRGFKVHIPEPPPAAHSKWAYHIPQEQKYAEMRQRMERLKAKGMLA